jgi:hypothetical protein
MNNGRVPEKIVTNQNGRNKEKRKTTETIDG